MMWLSIGLIGVAGTLSARLLPHRRVTTLLAASLAFFEVYWLLGVLLAQYHPQGNITWGLLFFALILCGLAILSYIKNRQPLAWRESGWSDMAVLLVVGLVLAGAVPVMSANGLQGTDFVIHGFYNGDVVTFASLVQKAIVSDEAVLGNPFAGNGDLEYPTLLHRGFAEFFMHTGLGLDWIYFWPLLVYAQIVITIPLIFLLWDIFLPPPAVNELWLGVNSRRLIIGTQALITLGILALSWDNYIYPQSHFFLTAGWLLLGAILFSRRNKSIIQIILGLATVTVLLLANAVTGTAAAALFGIYVLSHSLDGGQIWSTRLAAAVAIAVVAAIFILATPGDAALGDPHFSYSAIPDLARLMPWLALLLVGVALQFTKFTKESVAILGVVSLTFVVFFFSTRDIVVANSTRFIYHALLLGLPLTMRPLIRTVGYLRQEFLLSNRSAVESVVGVAVVVLGILILILPSLGSVASAYDNLLFNDKQVISFQRREILWWLADNTAPNSIIIANPKAPWDIPLFSGRALLRASDGAEAYWLSRDDEVLHDLHAAFAGNQVAQAKTLERGDYLVLTAEEQVVWPTATQPVFATKLYRIYQIK